MIPLPIVDDTLYLSASSLALYYKCPELYRITKIRRRESLTPKSGRLYGHIIHSALAEFYTTNSEKAAFDVLSKEFANSTIPEDDYRTLAYAVDNLTAYFKKQLPDPFIVEAANGRLCVERDFKHVICQLNIPAVHPRPLTVIWTGIVDLLVRYPNGDVEHVDHKTTSRGGASFFDEYYNDIAQLGYVWAMRKSGFPVTGFTINALICPPPLKTGGVNWQFLRQRIPIDDDQISEWEDNTINLISNMVSSTAAIGFPLNRMNCTGKFGRCDMYTLCSYRRACREAILDGSTFRDVDPSPIYTIQD